MLRLNMQLLIDILLLTIIGFVFLMVSPVKAGEPERIGIFTQADGTEIIEICFEDLVCFHERVEKLDEYKKELDEWEIKQ